MQWSHESVTILFKFRKGFLKFYLLSILIQNNIFNVKILQKSGDRRKKDQKIKPLLLGIDTDDDIFVLCIYNHNSEEFILLAYTSTYYYHSNHKF